METDKHYFIEGLFIVGLLLAAALFSVWLVSSGHRDDVIYRIRFAESVSGLALGDPVKFQGVDAGTVKSMGTDPDDSRLVRVDVRLRKETPVKTDTKASLKLKGITGVVFIDLTPGSPEAASLASATAPGQVPEIASEKSVLAIILDELPKMIQKLSALEAKAGKVMTDVGQVAQEVKDNPLVKLGSKKKDKEKEKEKEKEPAR
jgi:phospholipid/cholesterol/gamma-HCH transport system substrate-binding protein